MVCTTQLKQPFDAGAHVHRRGAQPELIDADHFSRPEDSSRNQAVQSSPAEVGQRTLRCSGPRRSSTWINGSTVGAGVGPVGRNARRASWPVRASRSRRTQGWRRSAARRLRSASAPCAPPAARPHASQLDAAPGTPLAHEIGVQTVRERDTRDRRAWLIAGGQNLGLELCAVATARSRSGVHSCPSTI